MYAQAEVAHARDHLSALFTDEEIVELASEMKDTFGDLMAIVPRRLIYDRPNPIRA